LGRLFLEVHWHNKGRLHTVNKYLYAIKTEEPFRWNGSYH